MDFKIITAHISKDYGRLNVQFSDGGPPAKVMGPYQRQHIPAAVDRKLPFSQRVLGALYEDTSILQRRPALLQTKW